MFHYEAQDHKLQEHPNKLINARRVEVLPELQLKTFLRNKDSFREVEVLRLGRCWLRLEVERALNIRAQAFEVKLVESAE